MRTSLNELIDCLAQIDAPLCAVELARQLNQRVEVVDGMLTTLAAMGKLVAIDPHQACRGCPMRSGCQIGYSSEHLYYRPIRPSS